MDSNNEFSFDKCFLVLTVQQGRNFPKTSNTKEQIVVAAEVNKIINETNAVPYSETPLFNTDLVWETNLLSFRKLLARHESIEFRVQSQNNGRILGQVNVPLCEVTNLDVKSNHKQELIWKNLENSPGSLLLGYSLQSSNYVEMEQELSTNVILEPNGNFFLIGQNPNSYFQFIFEIVSAKNIHMSISKDINLTASDKYYFSYTLFGKNIETDSFNNLSVPEFPGEEVIVNIHSSPEDLFNYFQKHNFLVISICSFSNELCKTKLDLCDLLQIKESKDLISTKSYNGFVSPNSIRFSSPGISSENLSYLKINLSIKNMGNIEPNEKEIQTMPDENSIEYCISIELKTLTMQSSHSQRILCSYVYPLFTSKAIESDTFSIYPHEKTNVPFGFCNFRISIDGNSLIKIFRKHPLVISILNVDTGYILGKASVDLINLLKEVKKSKKEERKEYVLDSNHRQIGVLTLVTSCSVNNSQEIRLIDANLEIETWKRKQKELFEKQLKELETSQLNNLDIEITKRKKDLLNLHQSESWKIDKLENEMKKKDIQIKELEKSSFELVKRYKANIAKLTKDYKEKIQELELENKKYRESKVELEQKIRSQQEKHSREKEILMQKLLQAKNTTKQQPTYEMTNYTSNGTHNLSNSSLHHKIPRIDEIEINRLKMEKEILINSGDYDESDTLIRQIDAKINRLLRK